MKYQRLEKKKSVGRRWWLKNGFQWLDKTGNIIWHERAGGSDKAASAMAALMASKISAHLFTLSAFYASIFHRQLRRAVRLLQHNDVVTLLLPPARTIFFARVCAKRQRLFAAPWCASFAAPRRRRRERSGSGEMAAMGGVVDGETAAEGAKINGIRRTGKQA